MASRFRIVLACANVGVDGRVAEELGVSRQMLSKWRSRFLEGRLEGLPDEPRSDRPREIGDGKVEELNTAPLGQIPANGGSHWSIRTAAAQGWVRSRQSHESGGHLG